MIEKDRLIIGLTGSLGSGVSEAGKYLVKKLGTKVYRITGKEWLEKPSEIKDEAYKLSQLIKDLIEGKEGSNLPRELLQKRGNELRRDKGLAYLSREILERIDKIEQVVEQGDSKKAAYPIVIDGIKNKGEIFELRKYSNFFLIAIDAPYSLRLKRLTPKYRAQGKDAKELEEDDERDHDENIDYGQQVDLCVYLSDILIRNDTEKEKNLTNKLDYYISLIKKEKYTYPLDCEVLMTHAYCESLKSPCLKRKVGAIISTNESEIVAAGYNLTPRVEENSAGPEQESCKNDYGMCYRDKERIDLLKKIKRCPHCGVELIKVINCPKCKRSIEINNLYPKCPDCHLDLDINNYFICGGCKKKIMKEFIGKLMEKCRALHAEEMAISQLSKLGSGISPKDIKATLYTTTYPCFQCANKIVRSIIKKVVYVEPYPQKESEELFTKFEKEGKINLEQFEGVKARALFRIFDKNEWEIVDVAL